MLGIDNFYILIWFISYLCSENFLDLIFIVTDLHSLTLLLLLLLLSKLLVLDYSMFKGMTTYDFS